MMIEAVYSQALSLAPCLPLAQHLRSTSGGQKERKLPTRCPLERNDRTLEAHQIATLMNVRLQG